MEESNYRSCWGTKSTKESENLIGVKHGGHNDAAGTNGQLRSFSSGRIDTCPPGISDTRLRASAGASRGGACRTWVFLMEYRRGKEARQKKETRAAVGSGTLPPRTGS